MTDERIVTQAAHFGRLPVETMMFRQEVSDAECRLYAYLTTHDYKRTGRCWPGREVAAAAFGWSVSKVDRLLRSLEEHACIARKQAGAGRTAEITLRADVVVLDSALSDVTGLHDGQPCQIEPSALSDSADQSSYRTRENDSASVDAPPLFDAAQLSDEFETWWSGYPRKVDKQKARRCYNARRVEGVSAAALLRARDAYAASVADSDVKYIKHGATFLAKGSDAPWTEWIDGDPAADEDPGSITQQLGRAQQWRSQ